MPATAAVGATRSSSAAAVAHSRTCHLWLDHRPPLPLGLAGCRGQPAQRYRL